MLQFNLLILMQTLQNGISGLDLSREDHIVFKGNAIFERNLFASEIRSYEPQKQWLRFTQRNGDISFRSIWYDSTETEKAASVAENGTTASSSTGTETAVNRRIDSKLTIGRGKVLAETDNFELYDRQRRLVFAVNTVPLADADLQKSSISSGKNNSQHQMTILVDHLNVKSE